MGRSGNTVAGAGRSTLPVGPSAADPESSSAEAGEGSSAASRNLVQSLVASAKGEPTIPGLPLEQQNNSTTILGEPLPTYSETVSDATSTAHLIPSHHSEGLPTYSPEAPPPPFSTYVAETSQHYSHGSIVSFDPHLNSDGEALYRFLIEQSKFPPQLTARIKGTHNESRGDHTDTVTDFDFCVNFSGCLLEVVTGDVENGGRLVLVPDEAKAHRGGVFACRGDKMRRWRWSALGGSHVRHLPQSPEVDVENSTNSTSQRTIRDWADDYCSSKSYLKSFTVMKTVSNVNYGLLEDLLKQIVRSTNYRGDIYVSFPMKQHKIIIYPENRISRLRMNPCIRWLFYLTFLWIFTWPALFFATKKWKVVESLWTFGFVVEEGPDGRHRPLPDASERVFCNAWASAIKRAAHRRRTRGEALTADDLRAAQEEEDNWRSRMQTLAASYQRDGSGLIGRVWNMANWLDIARSYRDPLSRRAMDERWGWGQNT